MSRRFSPRRWVCVLNDFVSGLSSFRIHWKSTGAEFDRKNGPVWALWDLGFKASSVADKGVVLPDLVQIMNGFLAFF